MYQSFTVVVVSAVGRMADMPHARHDTVAILKTVACAATSGELLDIVLIIVLPDGHEAAHVVVSDRQLRRRCRHLDRDLSCQHSSPEHAAASLDSASQLTTHQERAALSSVRHPRLCSALPTLGQCKAYIRTRLVSACAVDVLHYSCRSHRRLMSTSTALGCWSCNAESRSCLQTKWRLWGRVAQTTAQRRHVILTYLVSCQQQRGALKRV
jgi:hypothetical protein